MEINAFTMLILAIMAAMLIYAFYSAEKRKERLRVNGQYAQGIVVKNKIIWGRITVVKPVIRFEIQDGRIIEALYEHGVALAVPRHPKGATVTILYDAMNPDDFDIVAASRRYI
ncbi:DUF3592 domain-containing protein [Hymenobacter koreensis]|uniref:DUF3592 domain-containing protein n=1 Tax=Hymenobacter koreensis TaxID=1084523 RepID=A0ABP8IYS6_9BACT